jgi:molybdopterin-guanine dinucleotide biosynthesis protein A
MTSEASRPVVALLIARGSADGLSMPDVKYKALLPIGDRPMADYVLQALQASSVERIFIVQAEDEGLDKALTPDPKSIFVPCPRDRPHMTDSLICGVEAMLEYYGKEAMSRRIIMSVPCDIPLVSSGDFDRLVRQSQGIDADVFLTAIKFERLESAFPGRRYHSIYLKDLDARYSPQNICFASGNLFDFERGTDETRSLAICDHDGRKIKSLTTMIEKLRKHRHGKMIWFLSAYHVLFDRLIKKGNLLTVIRTAKDFLINNLTKSKLQALFSAAFNLKFKMLESDSTAFSGDIDCIQDLEQAFNSKPEPLNDTGDMEAIGLI